MKEIEKLYKNAEIPKYRKRQCRDSEYLECQNYCFCNMDNKCDKFIFKYPPFTAEKQIKIENMLLQKKKNCMKWINYSINTQGKWVVGLFEMYKHEVVGIEETREEALAGLVNQLWQDLIEEEKQQIKEILK